jgi:hypothetical protein
MDPKRNTPMSTVPHKTPCRSRLRPRGAGGQAQPLSPASLDDLARTIVSAPDQLPHHLDLAVQAIHDHGPDPVETLLALQALLPALLTRVAEGVLDAKLDALLAQLPCDRKAQLGLYMGRLALHYGPVDRLRLLRRLGSGRQPSAAALPPDRPPEASA